MRTKCLRLGSFVLLLAACGALSAPAEEGPQVRDAIVAVVNKEVITRQQVFERAEPDLAKIEKDKTLPRDQRDRVIGQVLDMTIRLLVQEKLLAAEAQRLMSAHEPFKRHIEEMVTQRTEEERRKFATEGEFRDWIGKQGLTARTYADRLREQAMIDIVRYHFVNRNLSVTPEEMQQYYRAHEKEYAVDEQVRYRQIYLKIDGGRSREKARALAATVLELLARQHDFAKLAEKYSDLRAESGGLYDFQNRGARPKPIDEALFSTPVGQTAGPVELEGGLYILRIEERRAGRVKPFEEVQPQIEQELLGQKRFERYAALIKRLEEENYVEYVR